MSHVVGVADIRQLAARISAQEQPNRGSLQGVGGRSDIRFRDGRVFEAELDETLSAPARPLCTPGLVEKFIASAGRAAHPLAPEAAGRLAGGWRAPAPSSRCGTRCRAIFRI
jgi:hypothetical protein